MKPLELTVRYTRELTDPDEPCLEQNLRQGELRWGLPAEQTALVLVDCWNDYPLASYFDRVRRIVREQILPTVEACRAADVQVVHAPGRDWARNYPRWHLEPEPAAAPTAGDGAEAWPPAEFRDREGAHARFTYPRSAWEPLWSAWLKEHPLPTLKIAECLEPRDGDCVMSTGEQLHRFCRRRKLLHLFYAGFAANICVQHRDYGMRAMRDRGYNVILLRDCTTAIEVPQTLDGLWLTQSAILNLEMKVGFSTTAETLQRACRRAVAG